jgi:uncharacterized protein
MEKNLEFNKVVYVQQKSQLDYDTFIDDSPYEAENIIKEKKMCVLYDQPWNRSVKSNRDLVRIKKLAEVVNIIKVYTKSSRKQNSLL